MEERNVCLWQERSDGPRNRQVEEVIISRLLNSLGFTTSIRGYHYLRTGVLISLDDKNRLTSITKVLYPDIAREYKTTSSKVERAIRHAIASAWNRGAGTAYRELTGFPEIYKPTNSQLITALAEYVRLQQVEERR